jgi:hypothetical protein
LLGHHSACDFRPIGNQIYPPALLNEVSGQTTAHPGVAKIVDHPAKDQTALIHARMIWSQAVLLFAEGSDA